jgi:hypothetical protein
VKYYRIKARGELQTIGKIKSDDPAYKTFKDMEKRYSKLIH